ncbi:MAG TPA: uroporphyrinogen decarboxylase family protein [Draconibacterium sp.]|nr:uroporphyrinogen decarboxylase family protein [Draconibacterium sp.]
MNSREAFLISTEHRDPGRLVLDFGATALTGIHVQTISNLRRHYGLLRNPIRIMEPFQMLGEVGWEMIDSIGIDVVGAWSRNNVFGFNNHAPFIEWKTPWGQRVMVPYQFQTNKDSNGDLLMHSQGDLTQPVCAKMSKNGFSFERSQEHSYNEIPRITLRSQDLDHWRIEVDKAYYSGKAVVADFGITTPGNMEELVKLSGENLEKQLNSEAEITIENLQKIYSAVGNKVNAVLFCKKSFASHSTTHSEKLDGILFPYYQKLNDWIHDNTSWLSMKHTGVFANDAIDRIIRAGFDILHLSEGSESTDLSILKKNYGRDLVFWGGGLNTQGTMLTGKPEDVRKELLQRCEILARNGGFVFNTSGNIPANVPIENFVAMLDAIREFNT